MERYVPSRDIQFACHPHRMACWRFVDEGILNFVLVAAQSREGAIRGRTGTAGPTGMAGTTGMLWRPFGIWLFWNSILNDIIRIEFQSFGLYLKLLFDWIYYLNTFKSLLVDEAFARGRKLGYADAKEEVKKMRLIQWDKQSTSPTRISSNWGPNRKLNQNMSMTRYKYLYFPSGDWPYLETITLSAPLRKWITKKRLNSVHQVVLWITITGEMRFDTWYWCIILSLIKSCIDCERKTTLSLIPS